MKEESLWKPELCQEEFCYTVTKEKHRNERVESVNHEQH